MITISEKEYKKILIGFQSREVFKVCQKSDRAYNEDKLFSFYKIEWRYSHNRSMALSKKYLGCGEWHYMADERLIN